MNANLFFILGASDPEMGAIERLLKGIDVPFTIMVDGSGKRVHPGSAYKGVRLGCVPPDGAQVVLVECGFDPQAIEDNEESAMRWPLTPVVCDHHRPGDTGFDAPPEKFWEGSSVGQVYNLLLARGLVYGPPTDELLLAAAGDHCPGAAYRGQCPGIDPEALMAFRGLNSAEFRGVPFADVMTEVNAARALIKERVAGGEAVPHFAESVPSLPEASLREGVPVSYEMWDTRAQRRKVGLLNASPEVVERWMQDAPSALGLVDLYGSPARGYAGGYKA